MKKISKDLEHIKTSVNLANNKRTGCEIVRDAPEANGYDEVIEGTPTYQSSISSKPLSESCSLFTSSVASVGPLKRKRGNKADERSLQSSGDETESTPVKKFRSKKLQGLTFEEAELRRSRTNEQERERQRNITEALEALKKCDMPFNPYLNHKEESKIYLLKTATAYIYSLSKMLEDHDRGVVHQCKDTGMGAITGPALGANGQYPENHGSVGDGVLPDHTGLLRGHVPGLVSMTNGLQLTVDSPFHPMLHNNDSFFNLRFPNDITVPQDRSTHLSACYSPFLATCATYEADVKENGKHFLNTSSQKSFLSLDASTMLTKVQHPNGLLATAIPINSVHLKNTFLHSTPKSINRELSSLEMSSSVISAKVRIPDEAQLNYVATQSDKGNSHSSANSSGYLSILSSFDDGDDSRIFSPDRLRQTIDEMYSESFCEPTPTQRLNFDAI